MIINVFLDYDTINLMLYYGSIDYVVNKILEHGERGDIELMDLPTVAIPRTSGKQFKINVTNETYLTLYKSYGPKSTRISLMRIIYWFMHYEKYIEFEWEPLNNSVLSKNDATIIKIAGTIESELYKLYKLLGNSENVYALKEILDKIKQEVWDA